MIEVRNIKKYYGGKIAVDDVSFAVDDGEILGFLGPNGAGKSTTMNILTGYISSNEGTVTIDGFEILKDPIKAKSKIGYLPEIPPLYLDMTVREYLNFMFDLKNVKFPKVSHIEEICEKVKIIDVMDRLIKNLSKGYKQRVGLAQALLGNPKLLILDEPTVGLDPKQIIEIRNLIKELKKDHTIILSSHVLPEIQSICDRVLVINKGKIVADDTAENLSNNLQAETNLIAQIQGDKEIVLRTLSNIQQIISIEASEEKSEGIFEYKIKTVSDDVRKCIFRELAKIDCPIIELKTSTVNLEDIFLQLTRDEDELQPNELNFDSNDTESELDKGGKNNVSNS